MYRKQKIGDIEMIAPDEKAVEMLKVVMEQNSEILAVNARIVNLLSNPSILAPTEYDGVQKEVIV
jgi:hypothetical protein